MTKHCFLHMGFPKTATTALQHYLHSNHGVLLQRAGLLYPPIAQNHSNALCTMFLEDPRKNITNRMNGIVTPKDAEALRATMFDSMNGLLSGSNWTRFALSAEGVTHLSVAELSGLRDWLSEVCDEISVAIVLRDPVEWSRSVMQQLLKNGRTIDEMILRPVMPQYAKVVERAWKVFGRQNVTLFKLDKTDAVNGSILHQVLGWMGLDQELISEILSGDAPKNESMSHFSALVLDSLNRQRPLFTNGRISRNRRQHDIAPILKLAGEERFYLSAEQEAAVRAAAASEIEWLRENTPFDWTTESGRSRERHLNYDRAAIDSVALLISNLINARSKA